MLALYLLSMVAASGLTGVFAREVLDEYGFIADLETGFIFAGGVAAAYAALQFFWLGFVKLLNPTRNRGVYVTELLSHCAAACFVPYLAQWEIPWPHPAFERVAPLVFLAGFLGAHAFFKLAAFYASLQGEDETPLAFAGWLAAACVLGFGAYTTLTTWVARSEAARPKAPEETTAYRVGDTYAVAREMREGASLRTEFSPTPETALTLRLAVPPDGGAGVKPNERVYATVTFDNDVRGAFLSSAELQPGGWARIEVPPDEVPDGAQAYSVRWTREEDPTWQRLIGLRPIVYGERDPESGMITGTAELLMAGPFEHRARPEADGLNVVLLAVDGLAASHVSLMGYERETTPALDNLGYRALAFPNTFTPAPEVQGAVMSMLTGLSPLRHGFLNGRTGAIPSGYKTVFEVLKARGYATAAFTEGEGSGASDLIYRTGFERGFETFDVGYRLPTDDPEEDQPRGSAETLEHVRNWIDDHAGVQFAVFARLRSLADFDEEPYLGDTFYPDDVAPTRRDLYDSALAHLDRHVGALIKYIRDNTTRNNTAIIVTAPYGADVIGNGGGPAARLAEPILRVPLVVYAPDLAKTPRSDLVSLVDVAPTIARLTGVDLPRSPQGKAVVTTPSGARPVSLTGRPLVASIRTSGWRLTWRSGVYGFEDRLPEPSEVVGLYRVQDSGPWWTQDVHDRQSETAGKLETELRRYIDQNRRVPPTQ